MKALIQRVSSASVSVDSTQVGAIGSGLLLFMGVERADDFTSAAALIKRVTNYRVFADDDGRMNRSLLDVGGSILVVSQFTLAADTSKGLRPGFSTAADPVQADKIYNHCLDLLGATGLEVQSGQFGANMQVALVNDGPVTFLLD